MTDPAQALMDATRMYIGGGGAVAPGSGDWPAGLAHSTPRLLGLERAIEFARPDLNEAAELLDALIEILERRYPGLNITAPYSALRAAFVREDEARQ